MNFLDLPLLRGDHSLEDAIGGMKQSDKRAVVVEVVPQEYRIYMNREIHRARVAGVTRLSNLGSPGTAVMGYGDNGAREHRWAMIAAQVHGGSG